MSDTDRCLSCFNFKAHCSCVSDQESAADELLRSALGEIPDLAEIEAAVVDLDPRVEPETRDPDVLRRVRDVPDQNDLSDELTDEINDLSIPESCSIIGRCVMRCPNHHNFYEAWFCQTHRAWHRALDD